MTSFEIVCPALTLIPAEADTLVLKNVNSDLCMWDQVASLLEQPKVRRLFVTGNGLPMIGEIPAKNWIDLSFTNIMPTHETLCDLANFILNNTVTNLYLKNVIFDEFAVKEFLKMFSVNTSIKSLELPLSFTWQCEDLVADMICKNTTLETITLTIASENIKYAQTMIPVIVKIIENNTNLTTLDILEAELLNESMLEQILLALEKNHSLCHMPHLESFFPTIADHFKNRKRFSTTKRAL